MRVLLVSQYFHPEIGATQTRMMEFARALTEAGHDVDVLTEFPNHPAGIIPPSYKGRWVEIDRTLPFRVIRVWVSTSPVKTPRTRMLFYGSFVAMAVLASLRLHRGYDVVAATSPPLPAAFAGLVIARMKRAAFVLDVRDLWPLAAGALNELSNPRLYRWAERLERLLYTRAARITVTTRAFLDHVRPLSGDGSKVEYLPNGTMEDVFDPARGDNGLRARLGLQDRFVATYAGLLGVARDLPVLLEAAERLQSAGVHILLVGEGPMKARLMQQAEQRRLTNVTFCGQVPLDESVWYLNASDVLLVPLVNDPVFRMFVPSKLFDAMACARPVILSVDGEARQILEEAGAGLFVPPGDAEALARAVLRLKDDAPTRVAMGQRGREFVTRSYRRRDQARRFARIVAEATPAGRVQEVGAAAGAGR